MAWGALIGAGLQLGGGYLNGEADKEDARAQASNARRYTAAFNQNAEWGREGEEGLIQRMRELSARRYGAYNNMAATMAGPGRNAAIQQGRAGTDERMRAALSGAPMPSGRPLTGSPQAGAWAARTQAEDPRVAARQALMREMGGIGAGARFDRSAIAGATNSDVDISRMSQESMQREQALAAYRQQILAQAAQDYGAQAPGGTADMRMYGALMGLGGNAAMGYGASQQSQPSHYYSNSTQNTGPYQLQGPAR